MPNAKQQKQLGMQRAATLFYISGLKDQLYFFGVEEAGFLPFFHRQPSMPVHARNNPFKLAPVGTKGPGFVIGIQRVHVRLPHAGCPLLLQPQIPLLQVEANAFQHALQIEILP